MATTTGNVPAPAAAATGDAANGALEKGKGVMKKFMGDKGPIIILIAIITLAFIAVIIWITFSLRSSNLKGKQLLRKPVKLDEMTTPQSVDAGDIPNPVVGREYTYSFWLYVDSFNQTSGIPKMIFYRGSSQTSLSDANPIVMMDGKNNSMYLVIRTQGSNLTKGTTVDYDTTPQNILTRSYFLNKELKLDTPETHKHMIITIDYVPMQRWLHVVMVVDNKLVTTFIDGEIYSVKTTDEYKMLKEPERDARGNTITHNLIIEKTQGTLYIGKFGPAAPPGSYLSNMEFFNYAISINDVKRIYVHGPFSKNFLAMLGISSYGVRSPVYKIDEYQSTN
jgi:hypothetical protein